MADEQEKQGTEEEFEILESPPEEGADDSKSADAKDDGADDEDDDDRRAAIDEGDDEEGDVDGGDMSYAKKRRLKKRQRRRNAIDETRAREDFLLQQITSLRGEVEALKGVSFSHSENSIDQQMAEAQRQFELADEIVGKAIEAGNGEDARQAMRIRDEAREKINHFRNAKTQVASLREQAAQAQPADARVARHKQDWIDANKDWYDGTNSDSQIVKTIDAQVARDGFDPATPDYWRELTRRTNIYFSTRGGDDDDDDMPQRRDAQPKRRAPPTGMTRETVGGSGKQQIYVTPEQKQAMIEAGYWDDPVKRNRVLKRYADQSRQTSAR